MIWNTLQFGNCSIFSYDILWYCSILNNEIWQLPINGVINEQINNSVKNHVQFSMTEKIKSTKGAIWGIFENHQISWNPEIIHHQDKSSDDSKIKSH